MGSSRGPVVIPVGAHAAQPRSTTVSWSGPRVARAAPVRMAGDLRELADDHVDGRAEEEAGHGRTREELRHPAHLLHGEHQEEQAGASVRPATNEAMSP